MIIKRKSDEEIMITGLIRMISFHYLFYPLYCFTLHLIICALLLHSDLLISWLIASDFACEFMEKIYNQQYLDQIKSHPRVILGRQRNMDLYVEKQECHRTIGMRNNWMTIENSSVSWIYCVLKHHIDFAVITSEYYPPDMSSQVTKPQAQHNPDLSTNLDIIVLVM